MIGLLFLDKDTEKVHKQPYWGSNNKFRVIRLAAVIIYRCLKSKLNFSSAIVLIPGKRRKIKYGNKQDGKKGTSGLTMQKKVWCFFILLSLALVFYMAVICYVCKCHQVISFKDLHDVSVFQWNNSFIHNGKVALIASIKFCTVVFSCKHHFCVLEEYFQSVDTF